MLLHSERPNNTVIARLSCWTTVESADYAALSDRCNGLRTNNCSMQPRSVCGDSDLSTTASRPAAIAVLLIQGSLKEVNMTIGTAGMIRLSTEVATMPFRTGIARSITIRSGRSSRALSMPSQPFSASPQITQSGCASNNLRRLGRMCGLSSTIRIDFTSARFRLNTFDCHGGLPALQSGKHCTPAYRRQS